MIVRKEPYVKAYFAYFTIKRLDEELMKILVFLNLASVCNDLSIILQLINILVKSLYGGRDESLEKSSRVYVLKYLYIKP